MRWLAVAAVAGAALAAASGASPRGDHARQVATQGTVTKFVPGGTLDVPGSLGGGSVSFDHLSGGIAADGSGNLFVGACTSDFHNRVVVFHDGHYVRDFAAGNCGTGEPVRLAAGPDGLLYATRIGPSNEIGVFDSTGTRLRLLGGIGRLETATARDIDLDAQGNVWVTIRHDTSDGGPDNDEVVQLSQAGQVKSRIQPLPQPYACNGDCVEGVAPAPDGTVWVTTTDPKKELMHLDAAGKELPGAPHLDVLLPGLAFNQLRDVDFANGRLYVVGAVKAVAVLEPGGKLVDSICCEHTDADLDRQVAVAGKKAYVPGIVTSTSALDRAQAPRSVNAVGRLEELGMREPKTGDSTIWSPDSSSCSTSGTLTGVPFLSLDSTCGQKDIGVTNWIDPCKANGITGRAQPGTVFVGGTTIIPSSFGISAKAVPGRAFATIVIPKSELAPGSVVVTFNCVRSNGGSETVAEWKAELTKTDPSGRVVDRATGVPVDGARVRLAFSLRRSGPFVTPGLSGVSPQTVVETTGKDGVFRWDVAPGFWRLTVSAFGYRALTSPTYSVPPPVTGLRLRLRPAPAQQRLLIDPRGRVAGLRLGGKARRVGGLRLHVARGRLQGIVVRSRRFRTVAGIRLGSGVRALSLAYPRETAKAARRASVRTVRVLRATFRLRAGRVVGIQLGR